MIQAHHGMLDLTGMGLIANLAGLVVLALAGFGIAGARAPKVLNFWSAAALVGLVVVICGAGAVIAGE
ncbi:MAG: hypothetical protein WAL80_24310 [Xanthobacteraceae bacterium]|jgi:hypothetical protein